MGRGRGRPPKPTALRVIQGNAGNRPLPENEPEPELLPNAKPPKHLSKAGRDKWPDMVELLSRNGLFTELDVDLLAIYCEAWADYLMCKEFIAKEKAIIKSPKSGYPMLSAYYTMRKQAEKTMQDIMSEFGMGPASRTKVNASHAPRGHGKKTQKSSLLD